MIEFHTYPTPNGRKVSIMLEEVGLAYSTVLVNLAKGEQFKTAFLDISPNNKIPALIDTEGPEGKPIALFESGAILMYLARKAGSPLLPPEASAAYWEVMTWLMFQVGGVGPMFGQHHHFLRFAEEKVPYAVDRFQAETQRLYTVMDRRLAQVPYIAGEYSIADIGLFPWVARFEWQNVILADYPNVMRWHDEIWRREAVQRGYEVSSIAED